MKRSVTFLARPYLACCLGVACCSCVERRFVIEANVPNAQVYINDQPIGAAPAHAPFEYYGYYKITLFHPGYEPLQQRVHVVAPWYAYPPFDFLTEVLWPFPIRDVRRYYFELQPATQPRVDELIERAEGLRHRGQNLPPPARPAAPRPTRPSTQTPLADDTLIPPVGPAPPPP
ncbi:MAG: PEGA domain-containing protein [Gemmataceae bacterium]|nr:PEGA domain-containing protein [Gemmataceae bacterium]MCS7270164.1 PEGA domain-containing protein [Gemmataceae bacterium]MDW8243491.1 PEGA domain-containing protein [Thermogemmata sp.]